MNNDRELLELAAKAAGIGPIRGFDYGYASRTMAVFVDTGKKLPYRWNPRADDGDGARMEAALMMEICFHEKHVTVRADNGGVTYEEYADHNGDKQAARRLASLRIAAEIGKAMP